MEEITINKIEWSAPEYNHKKHTNDWFWTIGLITFLGIIITIWTKNYLFSVFLLTAGASLILFTLRNPQEIKFTIETEGLTFGRTTFNWEDIKGFNIKKGSPHAKLLLETKKYFLPIYTIPMPENMKEEVKESLSKKLPVIETLNESPSMQFMEKLGF